ncbi:MAG TPA: M1 family metallopeptidase [Thermoanaerobaculia bacterium]|nr:M1 family metallopeptidase [Thermoanaerobaculia bacterium]
MPSIAGCLLSLLLASGAADTAPPVAGAGFDVERYRFELALSDADDGVRGMARIDGRFTEDGRSELILDLVGPSAAGSEVAAASATAGTVVTGMTVARVRWLAGDAPAVEIAFRQHGDLLVLVLPAPSRAGGSAALLVEYHGVPADGLIVSRNRHGQRTFFGDNWPDRARHWLPSVDHPRDKALVDFVVTAPDHYQVVANGALREETDLDGGLRRTHWSSRAPLATKVMVIGVARFAVEHLDPVDGVPVQSWVFREDRDAGFFDYALAADVLRVLAEILGPFPYAKLANVQSTTRYGGMENAGAIFYSERSVTGERSLEDLLAHEIAHQWFGDAVTESEWAHAWISEGFATYLTQVYRERTAGERRLAEGMAQARERVVRASREHPERTVVDARRPARDMLDANTYQKGAWFLHMLRDEIGDGPFFAGVRRVVERHRHANASTDDVRRVFEEVSGRKLGWLFEQWLQRPGHPRLVVEWNVEAGPTAGESLVTVAMRQVQPGAPFVAPLDLGIVGVDGVMRTERIRLEGRESVARIALGGAFGGVRGLVVDPDVRLLMELESVAETPARSAGR